MRFLGLAAIVTLAACSNDDATAEFVGTWSYAPGAVLLGTCSSGNPFADPLTGTVVFARGVDADLISMAGGCTELYDVSGSKATARTGQTCTIEEAGTIAVITLLSDAVSLGSTPGVMTESAIATVQLMDNTGTTCTAMGTWMLAIATP